MSFSEKLQQLRKANKMSQEQLADMLDVTRQSVSKWESGTTYPEMDKLIALCKIFKCSLDDLTNDDVSEINVEKKDIPVINGIVGNIAEIINKSIKMIKAMSAKQLLGLIFTMSVIGVLLLLLRIPFDYLETSFYNLMRSTGLTKMLGFTTGLFNMVLDIIYFALYILAFVYIYKVAYLDRYEFIEGGSKEKVEDQVKNVSSEKTKIEEEKKEVREVKIIERTPSGPNPVFKFLGDVALFCIRGLVVFICVPFIITLFCLFIASSAAIKLAFDGLFFPSILLTLLFAIVLNIWYLETCVIFIFNRKYSFKRIFWTFIIGICGLGCSIGLVAMELTNIEFLDEVPAYVEKTTTKEVFDMKQDLFINVLEFYSPIVNYEIDDSLNSKVEIAVDFYPEYSNIRMDDIYGEVDFHRYYVNNIFTKELWDDLKKSLKDKKIYNYEKMHEVTITIKSTKENIEVLKNNIKKKVDERKTYLYDECTSYTYVIDQNNQEIEELKEKNERLEERIYELQTYKDRVQGAIND